MARSMKKADIEALAKAGAEVERVKKEVSVAEMGRLGQALEAMVAANAANNEAQTMAITAAIEKLAAVIQSKEVAEGIDLEPLLDAVAQLKQDVVIVNEPVDYVLTFERNQRQLIDGEKGLRFTAIPRTIQ